MNEAIKIKKSKDSINAKTTAKWLVKYLSTQLTQHKLDADYCAYSMEHTFGEGIHAMVDGFCRQAESGKLDIDETSKDDRINFIGITLAHDMCGGLQNDKLMLPRVTGYENPIK